MSKNAPAEGDPEGGTFDIVPLRHNTQRKRRDLVHCDLQEKAAQYVPVTLVRSSTDRNLWHLFMLAALARADRSYV